MSQSGGHPKSHVLFVSLSLGLFVDPGALRSTTVLGTGVPFALLVSSHRPEQLVIASVVG